MKSVAPLLMVLIAIWIPLLIIVPAPVWAISSAAFVAFYVPVMDLISWRLTKNERAREAAIGNKAIDDFLDSVECRYGIAMRKYISEQQWSIQQAIEFLHSQTPKTKSLILTAKEASRIQSKEIVGNERQWLNF